MSDPTRLLRIVSAHTSTTCCYRYRALQRDPHVLVENVYLDYVRVFYPSITRVARSEGVVVAKRETLPEPVSDLKLPSTDFGA